MGAGKVGKAIKENCKDDKIMRDLLMDLLDFHLTGKKQYTREYDRILDKYLKEKERQNED